MLIFAVFAKNYQGSYFGNSIVLRILNNYAPWVLTLLVLYFLILVDDNFRYESFSDLAPLVFF